ncbi:MAG TPA: RidA family protein [Rhizomicrobium sp.]|jgi:enamine deaminase RidA (YjgF/YER057c/UK114 family)|nr:RidA family protein [Rhizomicrobium sp.]
MIARFPGPGRPRSRAVVHDGFVFAVATAPVKSVSLYDQTRQALAFLDESLAQVGSSKSRILQATVYLVDMAQKAEMNRAWEEWVDFDEPPQRACIGVALEGQDLVEIVIIAATS